MSMRDILERKCRNVETIGVTDTLKTAADKMREKKIAALVVMERASVRGILSERDIVQALSVHGLAVFSTKIADVMSKEVVMVKMDESVKQAMRLMTRYRTRHLLVLNDGALAGIVSIGDAVKNRLEDLELEGNVLRDATIAAH
jgi:CBS domain-containing protein